jgi:hypothetical protein
MTYTKDQIDAAINAAELVASETLADGHPVAVTNVILLTLIAGAKGQPDDRADELKEAIDSAIYTLRNA